MTPRERLVLFFYVLVRDHVPVGVVNKVIRDFIETVDEPPTFCSDGILAVAEEIVSDLGIAEPRRDEATDKALAAADHLAEEARSLYPHSSQRIYLALQGYKNARRLVQ